MNKFGVLFLFFLLLGQTGAFAFRDLTEVENFGSNPGNLSMFVRSSNGVKRPLVIVLHGCSQTAQSAVTTSGWDKLAELNDWCILAPQQKALNNINLCFNWFNEKDTEKEAGEMGSIEEMIAYCIRTMQVDTSQVFITGFSAGAQMAVSLMAVHPQLFVAGAIFGGGPYHLAQTPSEAFSAMSGRIYTTQEELIDKVKEQDRTYQGTYPRIYIYQGTKDVVVHPINAQHLVSQWLGINGLQNSKGIRTENFSGKEYITQTVYCDSLNKPVVVLFDLIGIGHQLLVDPGEKQDQGGKVGLFALDKDFWEACQVAKDFGLITETN